MANRGVILFTSMRGSSAPKKAWTWEAFLKKCFNGLLENDMTDDDMHFLVDGHHTSYVKYKEFKGDFVSLNRGFHTDL